MISNHCLVLNSYRKCLESLPWQINRYRLTCRGKLTEKLTKFGVLICHGELTEYENKKVHFCSEYDYFISIRCIYLLLLN